MRPKPPHDVAVPGPESAAIPEEAERRRPYRAPKLRHMGCVRDLALGGASGMAEGAGTFTNRMAM
ncbi:MAG: hypothetical protein JWP87_2104 [Labilithrix sp.]|nr:hypothetical protein [Labilithrix sp.]